MSTVKDPWQMFFKDMSKEGIKKSFSASLRYGLAKDRYTTTRRDSFMALATAVRDRIVERWIITQQKYHKQNVKRVYYLSMEFLIGRLLSNSMLNLDLANIVSDALDELGFNVEDLIEEEQDAGLGNGGLGRLAACFLDSMATLGIAGHGYGIRYDYGIFNQKIINGYQVEAPDEWLKFGNPWEFARPEYAVRVQFYGDVHMYPNPDGRLRVRRFNTQDVVALPYDIPITGYRNNTVNTLRLWSARSSEEFDLEYFNDGDYERAIYNKMYSENISRVLYPNEASVQGRELRLKQEYFFTAASIADIIRRFKSGNSDFRQLPNKATIQLNDTHPALAIAEFMRILLDEEMLAWDMAWDVTVRTFAYTNHTVMPEALESWPIPLFEKMLPRHAQIIYEINARFLREVANRYPDDHDRLARMSIIQESDPKQIRMAYLAVVGSHSVNGVSELHSRLLKERLFKDFYEFYPRKFRNITNGIAQQRWLKNANPALGDLITETIGRKWITNLRELRKLEQYTRDASFLEKWQAIKRANKQALSDHILKMNGIRVRTDAIFDVQVKRIHEYKRQLLFAFYIIAQYLKLKERPNAYTAPRTFIFSGKAAPGYFMAKLIIKFITSIASVINYDKANRDRIKVVFLENYRVSLAEKIFPASDVSEQISTAGTEASGTGCMKFMMNGALTVGTHDGANVEIAHEVGAENMFLFGLRVQEIQALQERGYHPGTFIEQSCALKKVLDLIQTNFFSPVELDIFQPLLKNIREKDPFFICADFDAYCKIQDQVQEQYQDQDGWTKKTILNVARSGKFSSDRAIQEYAAQIWKVA